MSERGLLAFDETWGKELRHKSPSITDDEFETPWDDYYDIIHFVKTAPLLDVFATHQNSKCTWELTKTENAFTTDWLLPDGTVGDVWVNHPHSDHPRALWRAENQYRKFNMNITMIIPTNVGRTHYWHDIIEPNRFKRYNLNGHIDLELYWKTIRFLKDGKPSKDSSRNAYFILVWRKKGTNAIKGNEGIS